MGEAAQRDIQHLPDACGGTPGCGIAAGQSHVQTAEPDIQRDGGIPAVPLGIGEQPLHHPADAVEGQPDNGALLRCT